jgi:hypothetical protein
MACFYSRCYHWWRDEMRDRISSPVTIRPRISGHKGRCCVTHGVLRLVFPEFCEFLNTNYQRTTQRHWVDTIWLKCPSLRREKFYHRATNVSVTLGISCPSAIQHGSCDFRLFGPLRTQFKGKHFECG